MTSERYSKIKEPQIELGKSQRARREAENGVKQFQMAMNYVRSAIADSEAAFQLKTSHLLRLNHQALEGIDKGAGALRNTEIEIEGSKHKPPSHFDVPEFVSDMCSYINENWAEKSAIHLSAYLMWRVNWIHPFPDGNGRTSRVISYMILNIKLASVLPGSPTIPDQISENKTPYYQALEKADDAWEKYQTVDVSAMEELLEGMLASQLVAASEQANADTTR